MDYLVVALAGFLAFAVQLLSTKELLPELGGSASTWIGSLMFFQAALFGSYWLTYRMIKGHPLRLKFFLATGYLINLFFSLWDFNLGNSFPLVTLVVNLLGHYGLIFMGLLMISPHLQLQTKKRPLNFYVASNVGSLMGLLAYPLVIEPLMGLTWQTLSFFITTGFLFIWASYFAQTVQVPLLIAVSRFRYKILSYAVLGNIILGAFSFTLIQDIVSFPLLWVLPLILFLLTYIWAFSKSNLGKQFINEKSLTILELIALILVAGVKVSNWSNILLALGLFTLILMILQLRLSRLAPELANQLPDYYNLIGLGGLIGGLVVNLLVPYVFVVVNEYLFFVVVLLGVIVMEERVNFRRYITFGIIVVLLGATQFYKASYSLAAKRNFYGLVRVVQQDNIRSLIHGQIVHGQEDQDNLGNPNTYYQPQMVGDLFSGKPKKILIIGLGAGVLLHYVDQPQVVDVIDINDQVINLAKTYFSFIKNTSAQVNFLIGDGRKVLEHSPNKYDLIIVDAFSGDAIPVHLLTREAFLVYQKHLTTAGQLALHLSNNYLDLPGIVQRTAQAGGFQGQVTNITENKITATWGKFYLQKSSKNIKNVWTDDFNSLLSIIKPQF